MSYDFEEREEDLEDSVLLLRASRPAIPRSSDEVGYAHPRPPYICRDRTGRWRQAHDYDERDSRQRCIWCSMPRPSYRIQAA